MGYSVHDNNSDEVSTLTKTNLFSTAYVLPLSDPSLTRDHRQPKTR